MYIFVREVYDDIGLLVLIYILIMLHFYNIMCTVHYNCTSN